MTVLPMFPLGLVHFPGVFLPLQVFEPRYQALTRDCLAGDREFGVVLIERGSEVGGGDVRFDVATVTAILDAGLDERGIIRLDTVGTRRVRVARWLEDDPYPRAEVVDFAQPDPATLDMTVLANTERIVRQSLALRAELLDGGVPYNIALDDDPARAFFQLAAIAPLGPADQQRLLATEDPGALMALLSELAAEEAAVLAQRLAGN
jgi:Lon protease-like protein